MKFRLKCLRDGKIEYWTYDNIKNIFLNPSGVDPFAEYHEKNYLKIYPFHGKDNPTRIRNAAKVSSVMILMGMKCNFDCAYCFQKYVNKDLVHESKPEDVPEFLKLLKDSGVRPRQIRPYGGEPLVYWKVLKPLIEGLADMYDPIPSLVVTTNGSLLTPDKVDFLHKYNTRINLSYDGPDTYRDFDILKDEKVLASVHRMIELYGHVKINSVLCGNKMTPDEVEAHLKNEYGITDVNIVNEATGRYSWDIDPPKEYFDAVNISQNNKEKYIKFYTKSVENQVGENRIKHIDDFRMAIIKGWGADSKRSQTCKCPSNNKVVCDLKGNIFACHNHPLKVRGNLKNITETTFDCFYHALTRKKCRACLYLCNCTGQCTLQEDENSLDFTMTCENGKFARKLRFESAMQTLFGVKLVDAQPIDEGE